MACDISTKACGWAIFKGRQRAASGTIKPPAGWKRYRRLGLIFLDLSALVKQHEAECMAIEEAFVSGGHARNRSTGVALGGARAVAEVVAAGRQMPEPMYIKPSEVRSMIGVGGRATKEQVRAMVAAYFGFQPGSFDESDAVALGWAATMKRR